MPAAVATAVPAESAVAEAVPEDVAVADTPLGAAVGAEVEPGFEAAAPS